MDEVKLWYINANNIFSTLSEKEKNDMISMLTEVRARKKDVIYHAGDRADMVYILKEGRIKLTLFSDDGKEFTVDILEPGDFFGELTMAGEDVREMTAIAMEDSFICAISRKDFEEFISRKPGLSLSITKWMGLKLRRIENRIEKVIFCDVRTRLMALLADLARKYGTPAKSGVRISIYLSHKDIAALIGASRETVTLELNNLRKNGDIAVDGKYFVLTSRHLA